MAIDESLPNQKSLIVWKEGQSKESLDTFLEANPPSKTRRVPGGDGWIWVSSLRGKYAETVNEEKKRKSLLEAKQSLEQLVERINGIDRNDAIPKIRSKTSGPSKKMLKDSSIQQCEDYLRKLGEESWPSGKWMFFEGAEYVDFVFAKLARSIIDGPLSKLKNARCFAVKVATADSLRVDKSRPGKESQQLICLYFDNIWNKDHATETLECIVKEHGQIPNSAKADLYTMIELDSNHPSKIRTTLYRPAEIFTWETMREWQDSFYANLKKKRTEDGEKTTSAKKTSVETSTDNKPNKKQKLGLENNDRVPANPEEFWPSHTNKEEPEKTNATAASVNDDSETESESDIEPIKASKNARQVTPPPYKPLANTSSESKNSEPVTPPKQKGQSSFSKSPPEPIASLKRAREAKARQSMSPNEKVKDTPLVVIRSNKKRDRFGRSDF